MFADIELEARVALTGGKKFVTPIKERVQNEHFATKTPYYGIERAESQKIEKKYDNFFSNSNRNRITRRAVRMNKFMPGIIISYYRVGNKLFIIIIMIRTAVEKNRLLLSSRTVKQ